MVYLVQGKSSLVIDTLGRALAPKKQTTSVAYEPVDPGAHDVIEGAPNRTVVVDQAKTGVFNPAAFLGLAQPLKIIFAESAEAQASSSQYKRDQSGQGIGRGS